MAFTADALVAHAVGDYLLQSHWMATEKVKRSTAAAAHAACYTLPFLFLTRHVGALAVIAGTHFVIDRWRLARYVCWAKNFLAPSRRVESYGFEMTAAEMAGSFYVTAPEPYEGTPTVSYESVNPPWSECTATGYPPDTPAWLSVWLLIIADNIMHILCNGAALRWL